MKFFVTLQQQPNLYIYLARGVLARCYENPALEFFRMSIRREGRKMFNLSC